MRKVMQKELEDSATPSSGWEPNENPDHTHSAVCEHPTLGEILLGVACMTVEELQAIIDGLTVISEDEVSDTDLEIAATRVDSGVMTSAELAKNRDVPSRVIIDPCGTMTLVRRDSHV